MNVAYGSISVYLTEADRMAQIGHQETVRIDDSLHTSNVEQGYP